jgi:inner membrane protein
MTLDQIFVPWYWIIAGTVLMGLEILIPGVFVLWIGLGALVVGIFLMLFPEAPLAWQLVLFAAAMLSSIAAGFVIQRRAPAAGDNELNQQLDALRGHHFEAIGDFSGGYGRLRVRDGSYAAVSEDAIKEGEFAVVVGIDGDMRLVVVKRKD